MNKYAGAVINEIIVRTIIVCVYVCVCVREYICIHQEARGCCRVSSTLSLHLIFLIQGLSLSPECTYWLDQLGS